MVIVDYGIGNVASIQNMLKKVGIDSQVSGSVADLENAGKIILAGVGAFDTCMQNLQRSGLRDVLDSKVIKEKTPVLGICVGMQMLTHKSEEGTSPGLGWINGQVVKFNPAKMVVPEKVPHMGWSEVEKATDSTLLKDLPTEPRFYFAHSYHAEIEDPSDVMLWTEYGYRFAAAVARENIFGVQFHPEKSHRYGMQLLRNFATYP
ncbi:imidazole glycerol phosphate synthase subunit HisH [Segetibacter sp. 3557_3]|nr:imidazole glycerol phosphate synthase subunit HisH [Segetibacter sp. 3557_3]